MTQVRHRDFKASLSRRLAVCIVGLLFLVAVRGPAALDAQTGGVSGRITFQTIPLPELFEPTDAVVFLTGEGLADVPDTPQTSARIPLLDQVNYTFVPRVLAVVAGAELRFHNGDSELHNIHTFAKGAGVNRMFNRSQLPGSTFTERFERPESILVRCDLHSQMIAHLLVLPNPFYTMPDEDGGYSVAGVPPGTYQLTAWHELFGEVTVPVEVPAGGTTSVDLTFSDPLE